MRLKAATPPAWTAAVLADFDAFLLDHAACERKAAAAAMGMAAHYPDRRELVEACVELAREELEHFLKVYRLAAERGLSPGPDRKDDYIARLTAGFRKGSADYLLDRLLTASIAESRGCERFALVAAGLPSGALQDFYREIARAEVRHQDLYVGLARLYFDAARVERRLDELLVREAAILAELPARAALY